MQPLALAESGWVWVGAGSWLAGVRNGAGHTWSAPDAALPDLKKTHQGREGSALPKPFYLS